MRDYLKRIVVALLCGCVTALAGAADLETAQVDRIQMPREQRFEGVVEAVNQATVSAQTSGRVEEVLFDVDDYVERGAVLVRFRATEQEARSRQAQAALEETRARLREAQAEQARVAGIFAKQLVARAALDKANADLKSAEARVASATARLAEATEQLEHTLVRAPYAGIVVERHIEAGEMASPGQPLMTGLSLERLRVATAVPQHYIDTLRSLAEASVYLPDGKSLASESITVSPYADPVAHSFRVRVDLSSGLHGLYPGMLVKVGFVFGVDERLSIPQQALVQRSEVTAVYVVDAEGRLSFRQVRAGRSLADGRRLILAGLAEGEQVALDPIRAGTILKQQSPGVAR